MQAQASDRSSATKPLAPVIHMTDPSRGDAPRDVGRVIMRVVCDTDNGSIVEGLKLVKGENFIQIYADRVDAVKARCKTAEHNEAIKIAQRMANVEIEAWVKERISGFRGTDFDREREVERLHKRCGIHWAQKLSSLGYHSGVPPLSVAEVVKDDISAPVTPENAQRHANTELARVIGQAIAAGQQSRQHNSKG